MISFYIIFILSPLYLSYVPEWKNTDQKNKYTFPDNKLSKVYIYNTKRIAYTYYDSNNNSMISIDEQYNVPVPFEQIGLIGEKNGMYYICPKDPSKNLHIFFSSNQTIEEVELNSIFDNILHSDYYLVCDFIAFSIGNIFLTYTNAKFQIGFNIYTNKYSDDYYRTNFIDVFPISIKNQLTGSNEYQLIGIAREGSGVYVLYLYYIWLELDSLDSHSALAHRITCDIDSSDVYYTKSMNPYTLYFCTKNEKECKKIIIQLISDRLECTKEIFDLSFISSNAEIKKLQFITLTGHYFYYFIWDEDYRYYYEGIVDISIPKVILNDYTLCKYISNNLDSDMSFICVYDKDLTYLFCPFSLTGESCDYCPSGQQLMLNHLEYNTCIPKDSTITIIETDGVYKYCPIEFAYNGNNCVTCQKANYYQMLPTHICVNRCFLNRAADDSTSKTCIFCKDYNLKLYKNKCVENLPSNSFLQDSFFNYYRECRAECATCQKLYKCQSCNSNYYLYEEDCVATCPENLGKYTNGAENSCVNCKSYNLYKYENDENCIAKPNGIIIVDPVYNIIAKSNIEHCDESIIDNGVEKCQKCSSSYYILDGDCVSSCGNYHFEDQTQNKCINCFEEYGQYKKEDVNQCVPLPSKGVVIINSTYGIYDECYFTCETCKMKGSAEQNNCLTCYSGKYLQEDNCVASCNSSYVIDENNKQCINCKTIGMIRYADRNECEAIPETKFYYLDESFGIINDCTDDIAECRETELTSVMNNIDYDILSYYHTSSSQIETSQYTLQVYDTSTPSDASANASSVSLGECEDILRETNSIPSSEPLIIYTLDIVTNESSLVNSVKYSVFDIRGNKLDLEVCDVVGVDVLVSIKENDEVNITKMAELTEEGVNVFNKSDPFFNDICVPYDNDDSAGLPFSKRKELYVSSTVCSIGCELVAIDAETNKANCKCGIKDAKAAANQLKDKFSDTILNSNFFVVKCVHSLKIKSNKGFFTFAGICGCQMINLIYFLITSVKPIKLLVMNAIEKKESVANPVKKNKSQVTIDSQYLPSSHNQLIKENNKIHSQSKKDTASSIVSKPNNLYSLPQYIEDFSTDIKRSYTEQELNDLPYDTAIIYDTRSFCELYGNYLKYKQPVLNAFFLKTDTQLKSVKIAMLFLSIAMSFSFNALFFTESIQNKNYETNGNISFLVTLPKVILSCVTSVIISTILSLISSFDSKIKRIKEEETANELKRNVPYYINSIKCKLTTFFIIIGALMLFFCYFVTAFCSVYSKYQTIWLNDSLKSLGLTMSFPFLYALGVSLFRYIGIKKKSKCAFCFAKVINIV